uniref:Uncharacterized protein n=1 Tax=viral metagenome TaxID=1070528 RepID=A0A6M3KNV2_9ZZZZ
MPEKKYITGQWTKKRWDEHLAKMDNKKKKPKKRNINEIMSKAR